MSKKLLTQGAEAKIYLIKSKPTARLPLTSGREGEARKPKSSRIRETSNSKTTILKSRTKKSYRHPTLDNKIRTKRTRSESKLLTKALEAKINVPKVIQTDPFTIDLEYIKGDKLSLTLNAYPEKKQFQLMQKLGSQVSLLHQNNIIHGDLTTSNTILKGDKVFIIDFGLGFISRKIEDKAVDLHLIKQALNAKHFQNHEKLFSNFLKGYNPEDKKKTLERLTAVERRGRYRH
jgi:Kae1-associated kinase Bud32